MEIDGVDHTLPVAEAVGARLDLLDPVVEVFGQAVAGAGHDRVEDAREVIPDRLAQLDHGLEATAGHPAQ